MITEWTFIASVDQGVLTESVNEMIEDGWQPFGGVGITFEQMYSLPQQPDAAICHYTQAMVKIGNDTMPPILTIDESIRGSLEDLP